MMRARSTIKLLLAVSLLLPIASMPVRAAGTPHPVDQPVSTMPGIAWGFLTNYQFGYKGASVDFSNISKLVEQLGHQPAIIHGFFPWKKTDGSYSPFPKEFADYARSKGAMPLITWPPGQADVNDQVEDFHHNRPQPDFDTVAIASGMHDAYINAWADAAKAYGHPVYVRLMHEVLGTPYPYAFGQNRNINPVDYVAAYRHVVDIFHKKNVTNVYFVWCFGTGPRDPAFENFFPGDAYADWVSLDGYNTLERDRWRGFEEVFGHEYTIMEEISRRPIMIGEIGSVEDPKDPNAKASWVKNSLLNLVPNKMPRIKAVVFFNSGGHEPRNYQVDSSPAAFAAYEAVITNPLYATQALPVATLAYPALAGSLLTINGGTGGGVYKPGEKATISLGKVPVGEAFDKWVINAGKPMIAALDKQSTTLTMPAAQGLVLVTATFKPTSPIFKLTVSGGCSGTGSYTAGTVVHIAADKAPAGKLFDKWVLTSGSATIASPNLDSSKVTMTAGDAVVTATYKDGEYKDN